MPSSLHPKYFFDLSKFTFRDIFYQEKNVWETLPNIIPYLNSLFEKGIIKANYKDSKNISIGEGTVIHKGAEIIGPAIIGKKSIIESASLIRGGCMIGENSRIGHAVEVKHSIFLNDAIAAHLSYIGDSIVGNNVNISGGAIIANFRLDKKPVTIKYNNKKISSGLQKFGAIIGDGSIAFPEADSL